MDDSTQPSPPVPAGTAVLITHGDRVAFVNPAATRLLAAPADQLVGQRPDDLFADDTHRVVAARVGLLPPEHGLAGPVTARVARADGTHALVEVTATALADASGPGVLWFLRDLAEAATVTAAVETARVTVERLRLALAAAGGGAWDWDYDRDEAWWSAEMYTLWGVAAGTRMKRANALAVVHEDDRPRVAAAVEAALAGGDYRCEFRIRHPRDGVRWMKSAGRTVGPDRLVGITLDVTDRHLVEEAARTSEQHQLAILVSLSAHIAVLDRAGVIVAVNPAWEAFARDNGGRPDRCGVGADYLATCHAATWADAAVARATAAGLRDVLDGRVPEFTVEYPCHTPDRRRWFLLQATPLRVPDGGAVVSHLDITARVAAEEALGESEEFLRAVLDTATDAIIAIDDRGVVRRVNPTTEHLFVYPAGELVGRNVSALMPPEYAADHDRYIARYLATGEKRIIGVGREVVGRRRDGTTFPAELAVAEIPGPPRRFTGFVRDITARKQLESRSLRAQRLESIGALASGIAHDLNNVLTPVLVAVKLLLKDRPGLDRAALLETARASIERGAGMIRQLLAFGGGLTGERVPVAVADLVREVAGMLEHTLPKSVALVANAPAGLWPVAGDPTQLTQVLVNLCVNARDAMPAGGTLTVRAANQVVDGARAAHHPGARPGRYVAVSVADTGTGMTPETLAKIFDPYFTTKPFGQGTGLGLATVQGIVKAHGGFVDVHSEPGRGARFSVFLPAAAGARGPAGVAGPPAPAGRGELVLVVDDEAHILTVARAALEGAGYRVVTAGGGAAAVEEFARRPGGVAAVVLDMMMPGMDGPAVLARLRAVAPGVRVLAVSGLPPTGPTADPLAAAGVAFLLKPYSDDELLAAVAELLHPTAR